MTSTTIVITLVAAVALLLIAVLLMGVKALFVKGGRFPSPHAHDNPELRRKGIACHRDKQ